MKMHQFAFVQKMPHTYAHCITPYPLNVQLMLRGGKVNMSMAPNHILLCAYPVGNSRKTAPD